IKSSVLSITTLMGNLAQGEWRRENLLGYSPQEGDSLGTARRTHPPSRIDAAFVIQERKGEVIRGVVFALPRTHKEPFMPLGIAALLAHRLLTFVSNTLVLLILLGLLWWGHVYKWKVPSFAALTGGVRSEQSAKVENAASGAGTEVVPISP